MTRVWIVVASVCGLAVGACSNGPSRVRKYTYPPDFRYIEQKQIRSAMDKLARDVVALDRLMRERELAEETRRQQAMAILDGMLSHTEELRTGGQATNHPLLGEHLEEFRREVELVRAQMRQDRPSLYNVGSISGACLVCHGGAR